MQASPRTRRSRAYIPAAELEFSYSMLAKQYVIDSYFVTVDSENASGAHAQDLYSCLLTMIDVASASAQMCVIRLCS
jgi:hypothetical protein